MKIKDYTAGKKLENQKLLVLFVCCAVFLLMFVLNTFTPYTSDDYSYHFVYEGSMPTENTRLLSGIWDIPYSMANHYNLWGGRVVAHSIVQFFMLFDKWVFNVFNSLVFVLCGILIYLHIEKDFKKLSPLWLSVIYFAMWFFIPQFGVSVMWLSGACNYIWMATLILAFLLPYRRRLDRKLSPLTAVLAAVGMIPFGFIAGCTNENAGGAAALTAMMFTALNLINKKPIPAWSVTGIISSIGGLLFLIIAPGNVERGGKVEINAQVILSRFDVIERYTNELMWALLLCLAVLAAMFLISRKGSFSDYKEELSVSLIYFLCAAANIIVLAATWSIYRRSWMLSIFYAIIICGLFAKTLSITKPAKYTCFLLFAAAFIISYAFAAQSTVTSYYEVQSEIRQIQQQKAIGIQDVTVTPHERPSNDHNALYGTANITSDRENWFNLWLAEYYGVNSVGTSPIESND